MNYFIHVCIDYCENSDAQKRLSDSCTNMHSISNSCFDEHRVACVSIKGVLIFKLAV